MKIPAFDLSRQTATIRDDLDAAIARVVTSTVFVGGPEVDAFEREVAAFLGTRHAIACANGTDALFLSLRALGIGRGDRVLTSSFTFFATVSAIVATGAEPVFADIDPETFNLDPASVARVLAGDSARIKAIVPVHLYGLPCDVDAIAKLSALPIVEDAAQAIGAQLGGRSAGTLGALGCFSFYPTKNLGCFGDGGLITTSDDALADRVRALRNHGSVTRYRHDVIGTNSRLDAMQAAVLRVKLPRLPEYNAARRRIAEATFADLRGTRGISLPRTPAGAVHAHHQLTIRIEGGRRDDVQRALAEHGVGSTIYYPTPAHLQPALAFLDAVAGALPEAERASREVLSLPLFPELTEEERVFVVEALRASLS